MADVSQAPVRWWPSRNVSDLDGPAGAEFVPIAEYMLPRSPGSRCGPHTEHPVLALPGVT
jgi:hypothetical protein